MLKQRTLGAACFVLAMSAACGSNDQPNAAGSVAGSGGSGGSGMPNTGGTAGAARAGATGAGGTTARGGGTGTVTGGSGGATLVGTGGGAGFTVSATAGSASGRAGASSSVGGRAGINAGGSGTLGGAGTPATAGTGPGGLGGAPSGSAGAPSVATGTATFTIKEQLASDVKSTAPTTVGIVTWSVSATGITTAQIDFGLDTTYGMTAPVDLTQMDYRTVLLGMKPAKTYHFRITASDGTKTYVSDDQTLTTGAKTSANPITSFSVKNAAELPKGFFITSFWQGTNSKMPFIFDTDGDVVWWYTENQGESTDGISRARMSADSQSIWLVNESLSGSPLRRVTVDGLTTQTYTNTVASHDICAVTGDTMAYLDYSEPDCNSIFEIDNAGTSPKEVFESTGVTGTPGSLTSCHGNAVRYSKTEDVYTYSDWQKDVAVVKRDGTLLWKLSQKVAGGNATWGGAQHGHQLLDNSILLYANNGGGSTSVSAAIEYDLNGNLIKKFKSGGGATNFGDVQRLSNGNTIITYSTSSLIQEVDKDDTVVLEVKGSGSFGYVEFRESLYGLPIDIQQ